MTNRFIRLGLFCLIQFSLLTQAQDSSSLPGAAELDWEGDLSTRMVAGIDAFLMRRLAESVQGRQVHWSRDFSSVEAYNRSVEPNRRNLKKILGLVESRESPSLEFVSPGERPGPLAETDSYAVWPIRWEAVRGVNGEGLILQPKSDPVAHVIALPDADLAPEQLAGLQPGLEREAQFARRLAEVGCQVYIPVLIDRDSTFSGNPNLHTDPPRITNMPHREWLYRMSYEMGRHLIGFEVQKVLALVDWVESKYSTRAEVGVAGYGEGGLIALYSAALDLRIDSCLVSGYFGPRERVWNEPIYRNVWALLSEFGDAEIASLILPRPLVIEHSRFPEIEGPPEAREGQRKVAAPGSIRTPTPEAVRAEFNRLRGWEESLRGSGETVLYLVPEGPSSGRIRPGSEAALRHLLRALVDETPRFNGSGQDLRNLQNPINTLERQRRQLGEIEDSLQDLLRVSSSIREEFFLKKVSYESAAAFRADSQRLRSYFWEEVIGKIEDSKLPFNPRSRIWREEEEWIGHEVVLDVWPDVFAWGILLVPKDMREGERRPVVVTQHGLEGVPEDTIRSDVQGYRAYRAFASELAKEGFVVFAPHNPYRGRDLFRVLQRKANPLKLSLFSFIIGQHRQILDWLKTLPFVDGERLGFYGLSYGGKTAMRVPAILEDYSLSICSGDFNEWIWKNVTIDWPNSYMFTGEYEMPEFALGVTFNYAEMAYLIFPRPFMVERGHRDGVGLDEWVAHEYAKVRRLYDELGMGDRTEIEFFNGVHEINGKGTFEFLKKHLRFGSSLVR